MGLVALPGRMASASCPLTEPTFLLPYDSHPNTHGASSYATAIAAVIQQALPDAHRTPRPDR